MHPLACLPAIGILLTIASTLRAAEPPNYGAEDILPTPQQPIGFRADGNGWYPGATALLAGVLGEYYATRECGELLWIRLDNRVGFTDWEGLRETGRQERAVSAR